jgi:CheY-like chemotaxis protein
MNLVANASEAIGDRDGLIRVTTSRGDEDLGRGREALMEGPFLQLEVSDTGSGMTFETRGRVFDPFFSTKAAGRGLGLAVVHGIVRSLGGSIRLMSEPGTGTTIQIGFPCDLTGSETEQVETNVSGQLDADRESSSLLIVEDEEALRQAVAKLLRKRGWSVLEAGDGSAALQIIRTHPSPIGVLLLDITLPGIASREVFEEVQLARPETKVIITSAYSESLAARTFRRGTYRFLRKPFQLNDLVGLMQATWGLESRD